MSALCVAVFFMSLYRSPAAALVADCFIRPHRTKANAALNVVGALAGVIFSIVGRKLIVSQDGVIIFTKAIYFVIAGMLIPSIIYFLFARENKFVEQMRSRNVALGLVDEKTDGTDKTPTVLTARAARYGVPGSRRNARNQDWPEKVRNYRDDFLHDRVYRQLYRAPGTCEHALRLVFDDRHRIPARQHQPWPNGA
jgi:hypothetical protein